MYIASRTALGNLATNPSNRNRFFCRIFPSFWNKRNCI